MQDSSLDGLNHRFAIPGVASIVTGNGNLPKISITGPQASAEIYLHGAQLTSWQPKGFEEVIFLSSQSHWENGKAIRGGIPICFPWFRAKSDNPKAPSHGFVRTKAWELDSITASDDAVTVTLATSNDDNGRHWWPYECRVVHRITVGAELKLKLTVTNTGNATFHFEEAMHTYHQVADAEQARIAGLDGTSFLDNMDGNREKLQQGDLRMSAPTDNAYLNTTSAVEVIDPVLMRRIRTEKKNSHTTVAWNPWSQGAKSLADLGDEEWKQMICAEASNILSAAITLPPGEAHTMTAILSVSRES
jgi:glucose-6-phosphate 1-epimerase